MHTTAKTTVRIYVAGLVWVVAMSATALVLSNVFAEAGVAVTVSPIIVTIGGMSLAIILASAVAAGAWSWTGRLGSSSPA
jgi:hypothetical protein